jgi:hypothetical protein
MTDVKSLKNNYFEYVLRKLIDWTTEEKGNINSLTTLKVQKLLFLLSAVGTDNNDPGLLNVFDNFYAMQYGPVESDIYNAMVLNQLSVFNFTSRTINYREENLDNISINNAIQHEIDEAISLLKEKNDKIINYSASSLIEITHKWKSWKDAMAIAAALGKGSEKMDIQSIINDVKYFS